MRRWFGLRLVVGLSVMIAAACQRSSDGPYAGTPSVEGDTLLRFPSGEAYVSGLRSSLAYLGRIPDQIRGPYLVVAGVECEDCDATLSVLLRSARDSAFTQGGRHAGWYAYPGRIDSYELDGLIMDSRLFWGRCLPGRGPGLVQFATEFDSTGTQRRKLVRVSEIRGASITDDSIVLSPPAPSAVEPAVRAGTCREVPPREQ